MLLGGASRSGWNPSVLPPLPSALRGTGCRSTGPGGPRLVLPLQGASRSPSPPPPPAHPPPPPFLPPAGPLFSASWAVSGTPPRPLRRCAELLGPPTSSACEEICAAGLLTKRPRPSVCLSAALCDNTDFLWRCDMSRPWGVLIGWCGSAPARGDR